MIGFWDSKLTGAPPPVSGAFTHEDGRVCLVYPEGDNSESPFREVRS